MQTAEETLKRTVEEAEHDSGYDMTIEAMHSHTSQALTAYRTDILSAIERGEDIMKLDLNQYNK